MLIACLLIIVLLGIGLLCVFLLLVWLCFCWFDFVLVAGCIGYCCYVWLLEALFVLHLIVTFVLFRFGWYCNSVASFYFCVLFAWLLVVVFA